MPKYKEELLKEVKVPNQRNFFQKNYGSQLAKPISLRELKQCCMYQLLIKLNLLSI